MAFSCSTIKLKNKFVLSVYQFGYSSFEHHSYIKNIFAVLFLQADYIIVLYYSYFTTANILVEVKQT